MPDPSPLEMAADLSQRLREARGELLSYVSSYEHGSRETTLGQYESEKTACSAFKVAIDVLEAQSARIAELENEQDEALMLAEGPLTLRELAAGAVARGFVIDRLERELAAARDALEESVKLQSHYASLLNMYDGGTRMEFASAAAWQDRLRALKAKRGEE